MSDSVDPNAVDALVKLRGLKNMGKDALTSPPKIRAAPEGKVWGSIYEGRYSGEEGEQGWMTTAPKLKTPKGGRRRRLTKHKTRKNLKRK